MMLTISGINFDQHAYDERADVLYLSVGEPQVPAETLPTPEGHAVDAVDTARARTAEPLVLRARRSRATQPGMLGRGAPPTDRNLRAFLVPRLHSANRRYEDHIRNREQNEVPLHEQENLLRHAYAPCATRNPLTTPRPPGHL